MEKAYSYQFYPTPEQERMSTFNCS
ncbi:MAG: helix-turn-helix domain-containing protein [Microcystis sp.]|nr:helix-turn-helix domain-containing protein [Microcystis sp. M62BS1]MCA2511479.1 helix-turn-helix domain-containing protein [Microcystis sp. M60BS1]MCA2517181.1 helix-turn-helix domain-containing protein [Microcystis sp. M59BS1]MCA2521342.1 helix-turn-helix domain-containing protein [Microcystis sp. M63BS1]MCA2525265.1 helix-turn-helix domain-containing protein [Microcystis sp. M61BS1]MCA2530086.1 helix-turn-helix domain-containing protein [Microcystis sp. M51BS1]MCA2537326.1 helix-turn-hel